MISTEQGALNEARPLLKRDGMTVSSFFRKAINDYLEAKKGRSAVIKIDDIEAIR